MEQILEDMNGFVVDALTVKVQEQQNQLHAVAKPVYTDGTDVPLEKSSLLLRRILAEAPFGSSDIEEYDRFLDLARECITSKWIELEPTVTFIGGVERRERHVATFSNLVIERPRYQRGSQMYFKTPQMCRLQGETYGSVWKVTATVHRDGPQGPALYAPMEINIGEVPVMLGSRYCILRGKSAEELLRLGEDPNDVFGYFVVSGQEKVILKQEKLVVNRPLLMAASKAQPTIRITAKTIRGTIVAELLSTDGVVQMKFQSLRQNTGDKNKDKPMSFNVVRVIRMIGRFITHYNAMADAGAEYPFSGVERRVGYPGGDAPYQSVADIEELLSKFVGEDVARASLNKLGKTFVDSFTGARLDDDTMDDEMEMMRLVSKENISRDEKIGDIEAIFNNDLFTHITEIPTEQQEHARVSELYRYKLHLLCFMLGRYLEHLAGHRALDNRDSWSNKRAVGAGSMMEQLLRSNWYKILGEPQFKAQINSRNVKGNEKHLEVTDTFRTSFTTPNWGVRGRPMKNNVAQTLGRTSVLESYAHMTTVDVSVSRKNVANSIRQIQQTQWNIICPVATPEGDNCGIVKNTAVTVKLSLERRDTELINILLGAEPGPDNAKLQYVVLDHEASAGNVQVMLNGKFLGWANDAVLGGRDLHALLRDMRRRGHIAYDVSIIQASNVIFVDMSPSRPIFPYLTVDPDTQELLIDQMNLREASLDELLLRGAVEYVSAWEQEYAKVAPYAKDIADRLTLLSSTEAELAEASRELERLEEMKEGKILVKVRTIVDHDAAVRDAQVALSVNRDPSAHERLEKALQRALASKSGEERTENVYKDKEEVVAEAKLRFESAQAEYEAASRQGAYDYCQIDPTSFLGVLACAIPYPDHNQAPRNTFQASMSKQPIGVAHVAHLDRNIDGKSKIAVFPTRPIVETEIASCIGLTNRNCGNNVMVAFMAAPSTEEDSFVFKKEFIDNGGFRSIKYITYKQEVESNGAVRKEFRKPLTKNDESNGRYDKIAANGMPFIGAHFNEGDCILGKVLIKRIDNGTPSLGVGSSKAADAKEEEINESVCLRVGDEGTVDRVFVYQTPGKTKVVVKLRSMHFPSMGDKFSPRNAQKGTIGKILRASELPYTAGGLVPDMLVNPSSIPSRMTLSYFFEMLDAKTGAIEGRRKNGTAFRQDVGFDLASVRTILKDANMDEYGEETMTSGITGEQLAGSIFLAPVYMQALKHQALSKNQARGEGPVKPMTRQPPKSKSNRGGIRFGEMERDAACAFGASSFVLERLCYTSDAYTPVFCTKCGFYADNVPGGDYTCPLCDNSDFGRCTIPYAYKLLEHLLGAAGIRLRVKFSTYQEVHDRLFLENVPDLTDEAEAFDLAQDELEEQELNDREDAEMDPDEADLD